MWTIVAVGGATQSAACADMSPPPHLYDYGTLVRRAIDLTKDTSPLRHAITSCRGLYPGHTGTVSLASAISRVHGHPEMYQTCKCAPWDHDHERRIGTLRPPPPCYVMSVRDPVARLQTVFSHQTTRVHGSARTLALFGVRSPSEFVRAFANASHPAHRTVYHHMNTSRGEVPLQHNDERNAALMPQAEFLRGLTNETAPLEYHAICTSRMDADWQAMLHRMPCHSPSGQPCAWQQSRLDGHTHDHAKPAGSANDTRDHAEASAGNGSSGHALLSDWLHLTPEEEAIVRECMYPDDAVLNRAVCLNT